MIPKVVTERQRAPLLFAPRRDDVQVMRVRPASRDVEEGAERIVGMRNMTLASIWPQRGTDVLVTVSIR